MLSLQAITVSLAIAGALAAYAAYGKFKKSRYRDLRDEVCEERESLRSVIEALPAQMEQAKRSPSGNAESMRERLSELELDLLEAKLLGVELPDIDYAELSAAELELRLVEILALSLRANSLADKYRTGAAPAAADDDEGPGDGLESPETAKTSDFSELLSDTARAAQPAMSLAAP